MPDFLSFTQHRTAADAPHCDGQRTRAGSPSPEATMGPYPLLTMRSLVFVFPHPICFTLPFSALSPSLFPAIILNKRVFLAARMPALSSFWPPRLPAAHFRQARLARRVECAARPHAAAAAGPTPRRGRTPTLCLPPADNQRCLIPYCSKESTPPAVFCCTTFPSRLPGCAAPASLSLVVPPLSAFIALCADIVRFDQ